MTTKNVAKETKYSYNVYVQMFLSEDALDFIMDRQPTRNDVLKLIDSKINKIKQSIKESEEDFNKIYKEKNKSLNEACNSSNMKYQFVNLHKFISEKKTYINSLYLKIDFWTTVKEYFLLKFKDDNQIQFFTECSNKSGTSEFIFKDEIMKLNIQKIEMAPFI